MKDSVVLIVMILLLSACSQDKDEYTSRLTNNTEPKQMRMLCYSNLVIIQRD